MTAAAQPGLPPEEYAIEIAEVSHELSRYHHTDVLVVGIDMSAELGLVADEEDEHVGPLNTTNFVDDNHISSGHQQFHHTYQWEMCTHFHWGLEKGQQQR
eukprot:1719488-Amphidinium_carterae.2